MLNISEKKKQEAEKIAKKLNVKTLFVNNKNEFFTSENLASVSVDNDKDKYGKIEFSIVDDSKGSEKDDENPQK